MSEIISRAYTSPGLIARARAYKLVLEADGLYVLHIGPASSDMSSNKSFEQAVISAVQRKMEQSLQASEAEMVGKSPAELVQRKHSKFLPKSSITSVETGENFKGRATLQLKSSEGKFKFYFTDESVEEIKEFAGKLRP
ncbi:hypothetical protein HY605_00905 [Candidatus Peregrinibacteria bacterium]|nr:hypothetical protein [Candidatus Peregrinibacteria bacterium]